MFCFKVSLVIYLATIQVNLLANAYPTKSLVPALYVFGDSTVDAGNNNNLNTPAKANVFPYGIDFNNCSTGRFSNGRTFADIIAIKLGLPMPPPYLGVSEIERYQIASGINYASGACGILNSTRKGECLSLDKQIEYFISTVTNDLPRIIDSKREIRNYLSRSIYLLSIGSNDYIFNNLEQKMGTNQESGSEEYADYLLEQLASRIMRIYQLGARKFVISNLKVKPFSNKLPLKLEELKTQLSGSLFVMVDTFNFFTKIRNSPMKYGLAYISKSCVEIGAKPCGNRKQYYLYDFAHTTEAANEIYAKECFSGQQLCFPLNIEELVRSN